MSKLGSLKTNLARKLHVLRWSPTRVSYLGVWTKMEPCYLEGLQSEKDVIEAIDKSMDCKTNFMISLDVKTLRWRVFHKLTSGGLTPSLTPSFTDYTGPFSCHPHFWLHSSLTILSPSEWSAEVSDSYKMNALTLAQWLACARMSQKEANH